MQKVWNLAGMERRSSRYAVMFGEIGCPLKILKKLNLQPHLCYALMYDLLPTDENKSRSGKRTATSDRD
jgi:hypothetical protein